ncbi:EAL domain-containing protein [Alteromonas sp. KUL49]|uniref:putative bifunctional diguanylate cyclase/phosphodiesterase n=1 Tax=Alteromonas sp. KUL49 TaxID=2480798 RepID=UPI00102F1368|nr:EAL domain-containing protein [Alteromonas sp. KUL49]TAP41268.1 EAL domain-containing protein [Alteromonas sp. KUL49]GEA10324.1 hypothetical protein KUL49_06990 [Alteromonas sp. KUL49]
MFRSIKAPIGFIVSMSLLVIVVTVLLFAASESKRLYQDNIKTQSDFFSETIAQLIFPLVNEGTWDNVPIENALSTLSYRENLIAVRIYSPDYSRVVQLNGRESERLQESFFQELDPKNVPVGVVDDCQIVVTHYPIGSPAFVRGYVQVYTDVRAPVGSNFFSLVFYVFSPVFIVFVITLIVCLLAVNKLLKPLGALSAFTKQVTQAKDYTLRHKYTKRDEIGGLTHNINRLLETIEVELLINQEQNQALMDQQEIMTRLANYDSLTGLPNRQFVFDSMKLELARAKRNGDDVALLFFDLDGFKGINDSLGHETGDLILVEVASRVSMLLREGDLVARLGGDEFLVVPDRESNDASLHNLATRLIHAFAEPFELRGLSLTVGVSAGIAKAKDAEYDLSELMSNADLAMYRSKAKGRGSYTVFTPDMVESHKRKLHLANAIEKGLANNEFSVYYQIKINQRGQVIGMEALLRWNHPEYGMVMPSEFIPIAEQGGRISSITHWIINKVCQDLPELKQWVGRKFRVSVNLSVHDLRNSNLFDNIYAIFKRHDTNPEYMEFEVTETAYLENFANSNKFFKRLSNMGCAIALDDFGTGYSSLSYLTQISIDTLKIDKQFVREIEQSERSRLVTGSIIDLAKRLSLQVCAEGIENEAQWEYLSEHGCDSVQGFLFSKPVPIDDLMSVPLCFPRRVLDMDFLGV